MENNLTKRYVYAVVRRLPAKVREDVGAELEGLIEDMLEQRCGGNTPTEADVRAVLEELGAPSQLAEQYSPDGNNVLVGPPYYSVYKMVLGVVEACVAGGMVIAGLIQLVQNSAAPLLFLLQWVGSTAESMLIAFGVVTLLFWLFQHQKVKDRWFGPELELEMLPEVPDKKVRISTGEAVVTIVLSVLFAVLLLVFPGVFMAWNATAGVVIPVFNNDIFTTYWPLVLGVAFLGIAEGALMLMEGHYSKRYALEVTLLNLASAALSVLLLVRVNIINLDFLQVIARTVGSENQVIMAVFQNGNLWLLGVVLFALLLESITAWVNAFRSGL